MTEREQFEAWAKDSGLWTDKWTTAQDEYLSHGTTWAWNAWQARATPASTFGTELSARIDSMLNKVFICANDEQQKTFNRMIVLLADCKAALTTSATPEPIGDPTEEMVLAGIAAANRQMPYINDAQKVLAIWKAMQARATPALPYQPDEIPRLVECLKKANENAEHFERQYYLLCDKVEELESRAPALPQAEHDLEDVRCQCCGYMTYHSEHMGCIRAAYRQALPQVPEGMAIVPVEGFKIEAGSEAYQEIIVTAPDGGQQIFWPEDAAYGLMKAMLAAAKEKGE